MKKPLSLTLALIVFAALGFGSAQLFKEITPENRISLGTHSSFFSNQDFFDKAFEDAESSKILRIKNPKGIVVNHHLLADDLIAETFLSVANAKPKTVVLISPNHFSNGRFHVATSLYDWDTPYGILESDQEIIQTLSEKELVHIEESPFEVEHGISGIVPFIKKQFPNARVVPIILKDKTAKTDTMELARQLAEVTPYNTLFVLSVDFSHYLTSTASEFHDVKARAILETLDTKTLDMLDIDSEPGLATFLHTMKKRGAEKFTMLKNTHSAAVINEEIIGELTSYITGVFSRGKAQNTSPVSALFLGDMMFDRKITDIIEKNDIHYPFLKIRRFFMGSDLVVANLEGVFVETKYPIKENDIRFQFDVKIAQHLKRLGFTHLTLANNHALDFGRKALAETGNIIDNEKMAWFGDPANKNNLSTIMEVRGRTVALVGYHQFSGTEIETTIEEIERLKKSTDTTIVYAHWGTEFQKQPTSEQQSLAHKFIDAGADLVVGAHPHVIQSIETYKNRAIFYSLGNFLFDQFEIPDANNGLGLGVAFYDDRTAFYLMPTQMQAGQIALPSINKRDTILAELAGNSSLTEDLKSQVLTGSFILTN